MIAKIKKNRNRDRTRNRRKNKAKQISLFFYILISFLVLLITGFLIFTNVNIARRRAELTERAEELRKEIQILEQKNQELQAKIARVGEPDFLEEKAREKLGLKKPGEEVVVILPIKEEVEELVEVEEEKNFWQKIWNWFGF